MGASELFLSIKIEITVSLTNLCKLNMINPFASIGRTGTSKGKVKVKGHLSKYLISDLIFSFFTHI